MNAEASQIAPKAVLASLAAIEARYDVPVMFSPSPEEAGRKIESWAFWFARELVENVNDLARAAGVTAKAASPLAASPPHLVTDYP
jgi:hypothetical protein